MSGVLSTMRDLRYTDENSQDNNNIGTSSVDNLAETTVFEANYESSYESNYSSDSESSGFEETAEDREATEFLNELLRNQSKNNGDFERIKSMLVRE
jgi:hypothetical protein